MLCLRWKNHFFPPLFFLCICVCVSKVGQDEKPWLRIRKYTTLFGETMAQLVKNLPALLGYLGSIPGLGRFPGEGKDYSLQYSGLENSKDCMVHGVAKSQTRLSGFHLTSFHSGESAANPGDSGTQCSFI